MAKKAIEATLTDIELKKRAEKFKLNHFASTDERAEAQTFWNEFFAIFDIRRSNVARFETPTKRELGSGRGFIDLFWKGKLLVEHKSASKSSEKDFQKALEQGMDYVKNLKDAKDKPKFVIICNFKKFKIHDLVQNKTTIIELEKLHEHITDFRFLQDFAKALESEEEEVNKLAASKLAALYRHVKVDFKDQEELRLMMIRILFCLFAEDSGIFKLKSFEKLVTGKGDVHNNTLAKDLNDLFEVLNTPLDQRSPKTSAKVADFPYVNGALFERKLKNIPPLSAAFVTELFFCCTFDWTQIQPSIFGSLFQTVMDDKERGDLGAHYTSETNILKILNPLFLNDLHKELIAAKRDKKKLEILRYKISQLHFLDPACGCGNFLILAYRELRLIDIEIIEQLNLTKEAAYMLNPIHLDNFFGIEYDPFSAYIAKVALWLVEHQMNMRLFQSCNLDIKTIPLREAAKIVTGNALRTDWKKAFGNKTVDFIFGNPPFLGKHLQSVEQKEDMDLVFKDVQGSGVLDYVTCWYIRAAQYIKDTTIKAAFVSTNSIAQGEQVGILWKEMFEQYKIKIHFAHQTFRWSNEASGVAAVHCVIVGFAAFDSNNKYVYEYENINTEPTELKVKNINPYLVEGNDIYVESRTKPICNVPKMIYGSKIVDDKNFLMTDEEKSDYLKKEPKGAKFIKAILSGDEFINGKNRWCFWLVDALPNEVKELPLLLQRIKKVKEFRLKSTKKQTVELANAPMLFAEIRQPQNDFLLIPRTSSENRLYIPFGFYSKEYIVSDSCTCMPNATFFDFGMLTSKMHMAWVKYVCGRLKSDYRYSVTT